MPDMTNRDPIILKVFELAGGASALAREMSLTRAALYKWEKIPFRHLRFISARTKIPKRELRPDLYED